MQKGSRITDAHPPDSCFAGYASPLDAEPVSGFHCLHPFIGNQCQRFDTETRQILADYSSCYLVWEPDWNLWSRHVSRQIDQTETDPGVRELLSTTSWPDVTWMGAFDMGNHPQMALVLGELESIQKHHELSQVEFCLERLETRTLYLERLTTTEWPGLRENLQETIVFTIRYAVPSYNFRISCYT